MENLAAGAEPLISRRENAPVVGVKAAQVDGIYAADRA